MMKQRKIKENGNEKLKKQLAKLLSGKKVKIDIKDRSVSLYVDGEYMCGFTGEIACSPSLEEQERVTGWEERLQDWQDGLGDRDKKLNEREKLVVEREDQIKNITKLRKVLGELKEIFEPSE